MQRVLKIEGESNTRNEDVDDKMNSLKSAIEYFSGQTATAAASAARASEAATTAVSAPSSRTHSASLGQSVSFSDLHAGAGANAAQRGATGIPMFAAQTAAQGDPLQSAAADPW